jgi:hypothetical protein
VNTVRFDVTSSFAGTIYAPEASATLMSSVANLAGSYVFNSSAGASHLTFDFDEALLTSGPYR